MVFADSIVNCNAPQHQQLTTSFLSLVLPLTLPPLLPNYALEPIPYSAPRRTATYDGPYTHVSGVLCTHVQACRPDQLIMFAHIVL